MQPGPEIAAPQWARPALVLDQAWRAISPDRLIEPVQGDFPYYDRWFLEGLPDGPREVWRELYSDPPVLPAFRARAGPMFGD